jgi:arsenate reductase
VNYQFICYPRCTTCQKARKWLEENRIEYKERNIAEQNPTVRELKEWFRRSGLPLKRFFNTSGQLYRELKLAEKLPGMNEDQQIELLSSNGMLVKRPLLITEEKVLIGFKPADWERQIL